MRRKLKEVSIHPILPLRHNDKSDENQCCYNLMTDQKAPQEMSRPQRHWNTLRRAVLNGQYSQQRSSSRSIQSSLREAKQSARRFTVDVLKPLGLASIVFINAGAIVYTLGEGWRILDSLYFVMVTLSTIGYGDMFPSSDAMKLFTMLYAGCGVCMTGMLLGVVGQAYISYQMNKWEKRNGEIASEVIHELAHRRGDDATEVDALCHDSDIVHEWLLNNSTLFAPLCRVFLIMMSGTVAMMTLEGWTPIESMYWTFQTALTLGYGDFRPVSDRTRWLCIVFIPLSVAVVTEVVATIAHRFIDRQLKQAQTRLFDSRVTVDDLVAMDTDKDGDVTELEFIEYMLKTMGKVDQELWDKLRLMFRELDVDNDGTLMQKDLELLARREQCAGRTFKVLELSSYKKRVMDMAKEKSTSPLGLSKSIG